MVKTGEKRLQSIFYDVIWMKKTIYISAENSMTIITANKLSDNLEFLFETV